LSAFGAAFGFSLTLERKWTMITKPDHSFNLTSIEINSFVDWWKYYARYEDREKLFKVYPQIYNKICGTEFVVVEKKSRIEAMELINAAYKREHADD